MPIRKKLLQRMTLAHMQQHEIILDAITSETEILKI